MNVAEPTPMAALLQQRIIAGTLASVLLLPLPACGLLLCPLPLVSEMILPDRDTVTFINGMPGALGTAVLSTSPLDEGDVRNVAMRLRALSNLSVNLLAIAADVSRQTYYGWLDNQRITMERVQRLEQLERTFESLIARVGEGDALKVWLQHESELGPPLQLLREGRDDVVIGLTLTRPADRVQTQRGRVARSVRQRATNPVRREYAYRQYSIAATEDYHIPSDAIEAGEILGHIRVE